MPDPIKPFLGRDFRIEDLSNAYTPEYVAQIAEAGGFVDPDIASLRRRIIAALTAYRELDDTEEKRKDKQKATAIAKRWRARSGLYQVHNDIDALRVRRGAPPKTAVRNLVVILGVIYAEFSGRVPTRSYDEHRADPIRGMSPFANFVNAATAPVLGQAYIPDRAIRDYLDVSEEYKNPKTTKQRLRFFRKHPRFFRNLLWRKKHRCR